MSRQPYLRTAGCVLAAALVITYGLGANLLSKRFILGVGHAGRPIGVFLILYGVGWLGLLLFSAISPKGGKGLSLWIIGVGLLARCLLLSSNPIQENDCYRYVLDGEALVHGVNPYAYPPRDITRHAPHRFAEALQTQEAQRILEWVGYPEVPTIYPPLAQLAFGLGALLTPWHWMGQRIVFLGFDVAAMALLAVLLPRHGKPVSWVALYAWNPLVLKEVANAAHVDSLAAFWLVVLLACLLEADRPLRAGFAGFAFAAAVLAKLYPVILLPVCLVYLWPRGRTRGELIPPFMFAAAATVVLFYTPFMGVGPGQITAGLRTYGAEWQRNDGLFRLIAWALPHPRLVASAVAAAVALCAAWRLHRKGAGGDALVAAVQATLLGWFLLLPAAYPWYAVGLLAVCVLRPRPWALVLSGAFGLYYALFLYEYREFSSAWKLTTQFLEHGLVLAAVLTPGVSRLTRARRDSNVSSSRTEPLGIE